MADDVILLAQIWFWAGQAREWLELWAAVTSAHLVQHSRITLASLRPEPISLLPSHRRLPVAADLPLLSC
jgi:hypothetical protein